MRNHLVSFIVALVFGSAATPSFSMDPVAATGIPFSLKDHLVVVEGSIGERGNLKFAIDTGATYSMISKRLAKSLRLKAKSRTVVAWGQRVKVQEVTIDRLGIGELDFDQVAARVGDLPSSWGKSIDALIGLDLLKRTNVTIDYESSILSFGDEAGCSNSLRFYPNLPFLLVKISVQERILTLILDTGAPGLFLFEDEVEDQIELVRTKEVEQIHHIGGRAKARKIFVEGASWQETPFEALAGYLLDVPSAAYGGADGILGPVSLGVKRIHLNFSDSRIGWEL